jgi:hypothetical protein
MWLARLFAKFIVTAAAVAAAYASTVLMLLILPVCEMTCLKPLCALDRKMALKAPWNARIRRDVPWCSTLLEELQYKRKERLFNLVDRHHVLQCEQFKSTDLLKDLEALVKKPSPPKKPGVYCCEMPPGVFVTQ